MTPQPSSARSWGRLVVAGRVRLVVTAPDATSAKNVRAQIDREYQGYAATVRKRAKSGTRRVEANHGGTAPV